MQADNKPVLSSGHSKIEKPPLSLGEVGEAFLQDGVDAERIPAPTVIF